MGPRVFGYFLLALLTALAAYQLGPYVPAVIVEALGKIDAMPLLQSISGTMLTISTFALSTMVAANSNATSSTTPRAFRLLLQDQGTQDMMVRFLGSFVFSTTTLLLVPLGIYYNGGRIILLAVSVGVIVIILVSFINWVMAVRELGSMSDTLTKIQNATMESFQNYWQDPLSGCELFDDELDIDKSKMTAIDGPPGLYVQLIDEVQLQRIAAGHNLKIYVNLLEGDFLTMLDPLVWVDGEMNPRLQAQIEDCFVTGKVRELKSDGRYGILMLEETASKALSAAVNDVGTARECIFSAYRIFCKWQDRGAPTGKNDRVYKRAMKVEKLLRDFFQPITHDATDVIEIHVETIDTLGALYRSESLEMREASKCVAHTIYDRAMRALHEDSDKSRLRTRFRHDFE